MDLLKDLKVKVFKDFFIKLNPQLDNVIFQKAVDMYYPTMSRVWHFPLNSSDSMWRFSQGRQFSYNMNVRKLIETQFMEIIPYFQLQYYSHPVQDHSYHYTVAHAAVETYKQMKEHSHNMFVTHNHFFQMENNEKILALGYFTSSTEGIVTNNRQKHYASMGSDMVFPGILLLLSTGGETPQLNIYPRIFRQVCTNGVIMSAHTNNINETCGITLSGDNLSETVSHVIKDCILDRDTFLQTVRQMRISALIPVKDPITLLNKYLVHAKHQIYAGSPRFRSILRRFGHNRISTLWGLANAVTEEARDTKKIREALELERIGGIMIADACTTQTDDYFVSGKPGVSEFLGSKRTYVNYSKIRKWHINV